MAAVLKDAPLRAAPGGSSGMIAATAMRRSGQSGVYRPGRGGRDRVL